MPDLSLNDARPFIGSVDFDVSFQFYQTLGWKLEYESESLRLLQLGGHRFHLQRYYQKDWCQNSMLHVSVLCVDDWYEFVRQTFQENDFPAECRISGPPQKEDYGRVFHVWDPAGVLIHFAQFDD